jgi:hypothetical protein
MLRVRPRHLLSRHYLIEAADGEPFAELDIRHWREGGQLRHEGQLYQVGREHLMSGPWVLRNGDDVIFEAHKPSMMRNRLITNVKGAALEISPKSWTMRAFVVVGPDWRHLGEIRKPHWLSSRVEVALEDAVPPLAQLFFLFQALLLWHRQENAASS